MRDDPDDEFGDLLGDDSPPPAPAPVATEKPAEAPKAKAKAAATKETAKVAAKKTAVQTKAAKAKASKATAKPKAAAKPKSGLRAITSKERTSLKVGQTLHYEGKYGSHKLRVVAPPAAMKKTKPDLKLAFQLDGKKSFTSVSAAAIAVMGTMHGNGWAFWKIKEA